MISLDVLFKGKSYSRNVRSMSSGKNTTIDFCDENADEFLPNLSEGDSGVAMLRIGSSDFFKDGVAPGVSIYSKYRSSVFVSNGYPLTRLLSHEGYHAVAKNVGQIEDLYDAGNDWRLMYWKMYGVDSNAVQISPAERAYLRAGTDSL